MYIKWVVSNLCTVCVCCCKKHFWMFILGLNSFLLLEFTSGLHMEVRCAVCCSSVLFYMSVSCKVSGRVAEIYVIYLGMNV